MRTGVKHRPSKIDAELDKSTTRPFRLRLASTRSKKPGVDERWAYFAWHDTAIWGAWRIITMRPVGSVLTVYDKTSGVAVAWVQRHADGTYTREIKKGWEIPHKPPKEAK